MSLAPDRPLPAALRAAVQRIRTAAQISCERTVESMGLSALSAQSARQRESCRAAQSELRQKSALFCRTFGEVLDKRLLGEMRLRTTHSSPAPLDWSNLSLVDDRELEAQVTAERFGLEIGHGCEWELRELDGFVIPMLDAAGVQLPDGGQNPLRPQTLGMAVIRGIEAVSDDPEVLSALKAEFARSWIALMPQVYAGVIAALRDAGLKPTGMSVRITAERQAQAAAARARADLGALAAPAADSADAPDSQRGHVSQFGKASSGPGHAMGQVDAGVMALMQRLAAIEVAKGFSQHGFLGNPTDSQSGPEISPEGLQLAGPNIIRAHREELRQASTGSLDHMVIDIVGSLFDQILSDAKIAPQIARLIGRLQVPVLRAALGDPTFFSSRKHPVRRFINRLASLSLAVSDLEAVAGQEFLKLVTRLVQDIVEGDFDRTGTYQDRLDELEQFVEKAAREDLQARGDAAKLLAQREEDIRVQQRYAKRLTEELQPLLAPPFLREFLAVHWSQVLVRVARLEGPDATRFKAYRDTAKALFMSVQPKGSGAQRAEFLQGLPGLMKAIQEGLQLLDWPQEQRKDFLGQLLPAHSQSLKGNGLGTLDYNMLARQVQGIFDKPLPKSEEDFGDTTQPGELEDAAIMPAFSTDEAERLGLVTNSQVQWNGQLDIDLSADAPITAVDIAIDEMPAPEPLEPTQGKSLAQHLQIGFAYQMNLDGAWQKVTLSHISPARTFFVFTHGDKHKALVSLTQRMVIQLCDTGRLRAFEQAYLLERATARARRQLAAILPGGKSTSPASTPTLRSPAMA